MHGDFHDKYNWERQVTKLNESTDNKHDHLWFYAMKFVKMCSMVSAKTHTAPIIVKHNDILEFLHMSYFQSLFTPTLKIKRDQV